MKNHISISLALLFLGALALSSASSLAEELFIKAATVTVREDKGPAYAEITKVAKGEKVVVIARDGKWIKVRTPDNKEGFIHENAVTSSKPSDNSAGKGLLKGASGDTTATSGEAGKGLGESRRWARSRNMSETGLELIFRLNGGDISKDLKSFTREGKVGSYREKENP